MPAIVATHFHARAIHDECDWHDCNSPTLGSLQPSTTSRMVAYSGTTRAMPISLAIDQTKPGVRLSRSRNATRSVGHTLNCQIGVTQLAAVCLAAWRCPLLLLIIGNPDRHVTSTPETLVVYSAVRVVRASVLSFGQLVSTGIIELVEHRPSLASELTQEILRLCDLCNTVCHDVSPLWQNTKSKKRGDFMTDPSMALGARFL